MLGKHPKNMTDNELLNLYDTYNSGIVMHEHQIDKAQILIKEMIKRNLAHREPFFGKDEWTEIMNHIKPVKISGELPPIEMSGFKVKSQLGVPTIHDGLNP